MCPYDRCSKTLGRARIAPMRKPTAVPSSSATRQRRSLCPMWPRVKRRQSPFHPGREAILRSTEIGVIVLEPLPHPRERIEIRDPGDPDARLTGPDTCHLPSRQCPPAAIRTSLPLKCRLALLQERAKAFFRIGHREEAVLQLPFESQALVHRHLGPFRHGPFDESDRPSRVLGIREAFREGHRLLPEFRPRKDPVE